MADAVAPPPDTNSPAGAPPSADNMVPADVDVADVLFGDDTTAMANAIARASGEELAPTEPPAGAQPPSEAGGAVGSAPAAPPVTPTPAGTEAQPSPAPAQPATGQPPASAAPAPQAPAAGAEPQSVDERALREASLTATVASLQAELATLRASPGQAQPGQAPESGQPSTQAEQLERFNLTLPQELSSAIFGEDPNLAQAGLARLINDFGTIIYHSAVQKARQYVDGRVGTLVTAAQQGQSEQERASARDAAQAEYYAVFPNHKNPLVEPIIQHQAQLMAAEFPGLTWDQSYINALGARVSNAITALATGGQPVEATPPPGNPPPARPAAMIPVGQRSSAAPGSESVGSDLIMETLNPF